MSQTLFTLAAQVNGPQHEARAEWDGSGITVWLDGQPRAARTGNDAIRAAHDYIGEFLHRAQKLGLPWGLMVQVPEGSAVYGEWPLTGGGGGDASFQNSPLVRIRNRWHDSGPLSALENAVQIIREYVPRFGRRAA